MSYASTKYRRGGETGDARRAHRFRRGSDQNFLKVTSYDRAWATLRETARCSLCPYKQRVATATMSENRLDRSFKTSRGANAVESLMQDTAHEQRAMSSQVEAVGRELTRYGLVVVVGWIGLMKFTTYEAEGIRPFVANSPLMSWVYRFMSVQGFSAMLGVVEVTIALLIAARPFSPRVSALGSALAVGMFLTTLSFLVTTPGVREPRLGGFPALCRRVPGQFLIKDLAPARGFRSGRLARPGRRASKRNDVWHSHTTNRSCDGLLLVCRIRSLASCLQLPTRPASGWPLVECACEMRDWSRTCGATSASRTSPA